MLYICFYSTLHRNKVYHRFNRLRLEASVMLKFKIFFGGMLEILGIECQSR